MKDFKLNQSKHKGLYCRNVFT